MSQSRCSLEPFFSPDEGLRAPLQNPPVPLILATLASPVITFNPGIMSVFYLILFPAGFSDIHLAHN